MLLGFETREVAVIPAPAAPSENEHEPSAPTTGDCAKTLIA
jgi:hypothetical protein